ncbi:hypothetical protein BGZ65_007079 [Modicella reniformis]|uniref:Xylanolytic transcriptional activator regulatory domain-containing protein n=1 Tax=Modicella reniformis TaxID=1440133 RepID=A0A9P6JGX6_9FUNG|nr:hypothetical protein BGZ65_007079 [Modicella reniformis]
MGPKDPLYSLSSASIRARKNALEMENIHRASQLYTDYIAKIKALSVPTMTDSEIAVKITATYLSEGDLISLNRMDVDMEASRSEQANRTDSSSALDANNQGSSSENSLAATNTVPSSNSGPDSEDGLGPIEGLKGITRSGLLHSLIQQYFTLIHPQFVILHKNHFLVRFWAEYGPFPDAKELHIQILQRASPNNVWHGTIEDTSKPNDGDKGSRTSQKPSPLLLLAMLALVSRHINDRSYLKSTALEKQQRIEKSLASMNIDLFSTDRTNFCQEKAQEAALQELMETDELGHSMIGENLKDRGEQYFQWASENLKAEYEEPSLSVVQSLLLLREYAIMAGNHTQAYMYGGAAITMGISLGWHNAHLAQTPQRDDNANTTEQAKGSTDEKAEQNKQHENRNIPVHIFDKTHLRPLPKPIKLSQKENDGAQATSSVFNPEFWLTPGGPDTTTISDALRKSGGANILPFGSGTTSKASSNLPNSQFRAKAFFDQQCRQGLLLDDILCFLSSWSEDLFVSTNEFDKLSGALDDWYRSLAGWQTFPLSGIVSNSSGKNKVQKAPLHEGQGVFGTNAEEGRDVVQSTLLGITFHTIRILLHRPFLRTNLRHPPCSPARASAVCAQSANATTSLAEYLINQTDETIQPCLLMRHQFSLVTAAGIQLMNANLEDEPRLSTPAKINLLKTIRILRDADRSSWGAGVRDEFHQVLRELFPVQMKQMYDDH